MVPKLVVELLMFLKPKFHHWRFRSAFFIQCSPSSWSLKFFKLNIVLAHRFVLPFGASHVDFIPKFKLNLEVEVILLLLTVCTDMNLIFLNYNSFIIECRATTDIVSIRVFYFNKYVMEVLCPLERWSHINRFSFLFSYFIKHSIKDLVDLLCGSLESIMNLGIRKCSLLEEVIVEERVSRTKEIVLHCNLQATSTRVSNS